jgi:hypothetical protein
MLGFRKVIRSQPTGDLLAAWKESPTVINGLNEAGI